MLRLDRYMRGGAQASCACNGMKKMLPIRPDKNGTGLRLRRAGLCVAATVCAGCATHHVLAGVVTGDEPDSVHGDVLSSSVWAGVFGPAVDLLGHSLVLCDDSCMAEHGPWLGEPRGLKSSARYTTTDYALITTRYLVPFRDEAGLRRLIQSEDRRVTSQLSRSSVFDDRIALRWDVLPGASASLSRGAGAHGSAVVPAPPTLVLLLLPLPILLARHLRRRS